MSVAGLKKQFHKASQLFSEKISGVEGTKLDDEFLDMERKIDITNKAVAEILSKATEYLQPNPAYRAKLGMLNTVSKIRGQVKTTGYPQTEGLLGDCMLKYGKELGEGSTFGSALIEVGESMKLMAEVKDSLDINVKQTFIDPLQLLQDKDLKEIGHHLKKLEGRRLDYDYKKKRVGRTSQPAGRVCRGRFRLSQTVHRDSAGAAEQATDEDIGCIQHPQARIQATAHKKESQRAQWGVHCRLSKDNSFRVWEVQDQGAGRLVVGLQQTGRSRLERPGGLLREGPLSAGKSDRSQPDDKGGKRNTIKSRNKISKRHSSLGHLLKDKEPSSGSNAPVDQPCCRGLYDFEPENQGELGFKEGDIITLTNQIDENWYEGVLRGESGFFPINYVEVIVPLPQ
ncbi:endophilin-A3 isoform X1 [Ovis canadensis]|uniref:endophilin-A3 isoform X1 n=2 Tax=Ovis canadensis TaxID=37174 RepID=UPI003751DCA3